MIAILSIQGLVFISYPDWFVSNIKLTRYQNMSFMLDIACILCNTVNTRYFNITIIILHKNILIVVDAKLLFTLAIVGKGMFESTVIQFQMIEASSNHQYIHSLVLLEFIYQ